LHWDFLNQIIYGISYVVSSMSAIDKVVDGRSIRPVWWPLLGVCLDQLHAVCMLCCFVHLQHYTKHEAGVAAETLRRTPEAAVSAVGTAGEVVSGVAGHIIDKVGLGCAPE
jgi:hypothetical protein